MTDIVQRAGHAGTLAPELQSNEHRFAKAAFKAWIAHLRELTTRQSLLNLLGLDKALLEAVVDELITAGYRQDLPGQLSRAVLKRAQSGARRWLWCLRSARAEKSGVRCR